MTPSAAAARPAGPVWVRAAEAGLSFRPMDAADLPFLAQVYAATRAHELAMVPWSPEQKAAFVAQQFVAQHAHYSLHHADMDWLVVSRHGEPIGRLYLDRGATDYAIVDISLLPPHRGGGLGMALLRDVLDEAGGSGRTVSIHVEKFNPARRLYGRLGFVMVEDKGIYDEMRWTASGRTWSDQVNTTS